MRKLAVMVASLISSISVSHAEIANDKVKIGLLSDLSGPYEADTGNGSVLAAQIAAEEFGNKVNGVPIEILAADHQNKPDVGVAIANKWFDIDKVDAIADLVNSAVAMAVVDVAKQKTRPFCWSAPALQSLLAKHARPIRWCIGLMIRICSRMRMAEWCQRSAGNGL